MLSKFRVLAGILRYAAPFLNQPFRHNCTGAKPPKLDQLKPKTPEDEYRDLLQKCLNTNGDAKKCAEKPGNGKPTVEKAAANLQKGAPASTSLSKKDEKGIFDNTNKDKPFSTPSSTPVSTPTSKPNSPRSSTTSGATSPQDGAGKPLTIEDLERISKESKGRCLTKNGEKENGQDGKSGRTIEDLEKISANSKGRCIGGNGEGEKPKSVCPPPQRKEVQPPAAPKKNPCTLPPNNGGDGTKKARTIEDLEKISQRSTGRCLDSDKKKKIPQPQASNPEKSCTQKKGPLPSPNREKKPAPGRVGSPKVQNKSLCPPKSNAPKPNTAQKDKSNIGEKITAMCQPKKDGPTKGPVCQPKKEDPPPKNESQLNPNLKDKDPICSSKSDKEKDGAACSPKVDTKKDTSDQKNLEKKEAIPPKTDEIKLDTKEEKKLSTPREKEKLSTPRDKEKEPAPKTEEKRICPPKNEDTMSVLEKCRTPRTENKPQEKAQTPRGDGKSLCPPKENKPQDKCRTPREDKPPCPPKENKQEEKAKSMCPPSKTKREESSACQTRPIKEQPPKEDNKKCPEKKDPCAPKKKEANPCKLGGDEKPCKPKDPCKGKEQETMKMNALVLCVKDREVALEQVAIPNLLKKDEVSIKVKYATANITDLAMIEGKIKSCQEVVIPGRELSGIVCGTGDGVQHVKAGNTVVVAPCQPNTLCKFCTDEKYSTCVKESAGKAFGVDRDGGWAQFAVVPANLVYKVEEIHLQKAVLLPSLAQVMCALGKMTISPQTEILIQGCSLAGCLAALLLRQNGHERAVILEDNPKRMEVADKLNVDYPLVSIEDLCNMQVDLIISSGGTSEAIQESLKSLAPHGNFVLFGQPGRNTAPEIKITTSELSKKSLTIRGISGTPINPANISPELANRMLDLCRLGVPTFPMKEFTEALTRLTTGDVNTIIFQVCKEL